MFDSIHNIIKTNLNAVYAPHIIRIIVLYLCYTGKHTNPCSDQGYKYMCLVSHAQYFAILQFFIFIFSTHVKLLPVIHCNWLPVYSESILIQI